MKKRIILMIMLACMWSSSNGQNPRHTIDSLRNELEKIEQDTSRLRIIKQMADSFAYSNFPDSSVSYAFKSLTVARAIGYKEEVNALLQLEIALRHNGNEVKAFSVTLNGLKKAELHKMPNFRAEFLGELGIIYRESGHYDKALQYLRNSKSVYDSIKDIELSLYQQSNIGEVYLLQGLLDSALYYCQPVVEKAKTTWIIFYAQVNLAKIYLEKHNYNIALSYLWPTARYAAFSSHRFAINYLLAQTYQSLNNMDSCIYYARESLQIANESAIYANIIKANVFLSGIYEHRDPQKALAYSQAALKYNDSLYKYSETLSMESFDEFNRQEKQYETKAATVAYQYKLRQYGLLGSIGVLLAIAFFLFYNNRQKQKANRLLEKQKIEIDFQRDKAEKTLLELKATQSQLIQSEKLASLGAVTAGIAHEIQNPLNFVNNFSEVNKELVDEMQTELKAGNTQEAIAISNDIKENEQKINYHGKRADAIVKGMLQHSRQTSGTKEPTDINALCDEYLRLSYHGLRAKDKNFNADFKTDFDESIGKINIVPQEIGRVLLNLYNNAFYAINEKKKTAGEDYKPLVSIETKKINARPDDTVGRDKVEIEVSDNGNGIPQNIVDKIFQPFFTTKPTGQGTGLGLSLSYDIIKAHGGEITVNTREGGGTEFTITLPV
jgi:two-component system NtrC family sensor kinase